GERRESYATLMLRQLRYNKLEQAKLKSLIIDPDTAKRYWVLNAQYLRDAYRCGQYGQEIPCISR
ncbi:MAG: hypothetical protein K2I08_11475, partial [Muribaculaceae bacterium]|nr:hypothetical protein [Muribaculaceae bacterium]